MIRNCVLRSLPMNICTLQKIPMTTRTKHIAGPCNGREMSEIAKSLSMAPRKGDCKNDSMA